MAVAGVAALLEERLDVVAEQRQTVRFTLALNLGGRNLRCAQR